MPPLPRYRARSVFYMISLGLFTVAAIITLLYALGYSVDVRSRAAVKNGLIVLGSTPSNAFITINNEVRQERTNTRLTLPPNNYHVKVDKPGVHPWEKRISIGPGEAILEEDIFLFVREPTLVTITESGVIARTLSPDSRQVAYVKRETGSLGVWIAETGEAPTPIRLAALPESYAQPVSLVFSGDGTSVAVSTTTESSVIATTTNPPRTIRVVPLGGAVQFAPREPNRLLGLNNGRLLSVGFNDGQPQVIEPDVTSWSTNDSAVYIAKSTSKTLTRLDLRSGTRRVLSPDFVTAELWARPGFEAVLVKDQNQTLFAIIDDKPLQVAERVERYAATRDGAFIAYVSAREVTLWKRDTRQASLVTRFSELPNHLEPFSGGKYLLYTQKNQLHSLANDGANDHALLDTDGIGPLLTESRRLVVLDPASGRLVSQNLLPINQ